MLSERYRSAELGAARYVHRVTEVYESNALEGLGLSLPRTEFVVRSVRWNSDWTRYSIAEALASDAHLYDVLGLHRARSLADLITESTEMPVTEVDLRAMHKVILGNHPAGGRYKRYTNQISGSAHQPPAPSDVPEHMRQLADWLSSDRGDPLVRATVAHAWMTHIHPFEDGNGRMARLLANLVLARAGYPPVIVKATTHKLAYLDALAASDQGGDLSDLIRIFTGLIKASLRDVERPDQLLRAWRRRLTAIEPNRSRRWSTDLDQFLQAVAHHLAAPLVFEVAPLPEAEDYERIMSGTAILNPIVARVTSSADLDFALYFVVSQPTNSAQPAFGISEHHPTIKFMQRTFNLIDPRPYRRVACGVSFPFQEIVLRPENLPAVHMIGRTNLDCELDRAGQEIAMQCATWASGYRLPRITDTVFTDDIMGRAPLTGPKARPQRMRTRFERGIW